MFIIFTPIFPFDISNIKNHTAIDFTTPQKKQKNRREPTSQHRKVTVTLAVRPGEKLPEAKWKVPQRTSIDPKTDFPTFFLR